MYIDSSLYNSFHIYIDIVSNNTINFNINDIDSTSPLSTIYSIYEPRINIHKYVDTIINQIYNEDTHIDGLIITAVCLIKRIISNIMLNKYSIHRFIAVILMLSQKLYDDLYYSNKCWSQICGLTLEDINSIERDILVFLDYKTFIKHEEMISVAKCIKYLE